MHMQNNRFSWLFLVLVTIIMLSLAPAACAAGRLAPLPPSGGKYTVRVNDTLWDIATRYGMTVAQLTAMNPGVNPAALRPGQTLVILTKTSQDSDTVSQAPSAIYVVTPNDTLWDIAANYGLYVDDVLAANPGVDPRRLMVGQELIIPGISQEALAAQAAPAVELPAAPEAPPAAEAAPAGEPAGEPASAPTGAPEISPLAREMLDRINGKRIAGGLAALTWNEQLAAAAQAHAQDCAARNRGSHVGSDGARLAARLERAGYAPSWSGENWANARSAEHAVAMWWNEPRGADPHVQNIMARRATEIGIGVARGAWGLYFIADFGSQ